MVGICVLARLMIDAICVHTWGMGRIPKAWAAVLLIVLAAPSADAWPDAAAAVAVYYAPETNLEQVDLRILEAARRSIDFAGYNLSNHAVIQALHRLARSGVRVRLLLLRSRDTTSLDRNWIEHRPVGAASQVARPVADGSAME